MLFRSGVDYIGGHGSTGVAWSGTVPAPPAPPAATVSGIVPATGSSAGGTPVTITGTNFAAGATVSLGGSAATSVTVLNATTIVAVAGAHAIGTVDVVVTSDNRVATLPAAFTYSPAPQISGVSPAVGPTGGGTLLTITGSGFVAGATVRVGGVASGSVDVVNASTIRAVTPAHAVGTVDVEVVIAGVTATRPSSFTYLLPVPHTFAVATVAFGDSITYGTSSTIVTVDGSPAVRSQVIEGYPEKLQRAMRTRYTVQPVGVANEGIPGECASAVCFPAMDRGENRLAATLTPADDLVIILEGVNDLNGQRTISSIADALRRMVQTGKQDGRFVIITTLLPVKADEVSGVPRNDINRIRAGAS